MPGGPTRFSIWLVCPLTREKGVAEEAQPVKHTPLALLSQSRHLAVLEEGAARQLARRQRRQGDGVLRAVVRRARPAVRRHVGVAVAGAAAVDLDAWVQHAEASRANAVRSRCR